MAISLADVAFLRSERAGALLAAHATSDLSPQNSLRLLSDLRKTLTPAEAAAILTTLRLRQKARTKFPRWSASMLFTDAGLQQASHPLVRRYRAGSVKSASVLDLCCGIGADSFAFASAGRQVLGLDLDPVRIAIARHNAAAIGLSAKFSVADVRQALPAGYDCIFFDPGRRDQEGRRIHHVEHYQPPLALARQFKAREIMVKLSPGVNLRQLDGYGGQLEFISVRGQLTEALLWLHRPSAQPSATLINDCDTHHMIHRDIERAPVTPPKAWLFEPDPAILRAGLVQQLAHVLDASMLDRSIAYLTMDRRPRTPWGSCWRILDWMPFQLKRLRRYLVERGVGQITVKKRGFPLAPEELIARLRLKQGDSARALALTRQNDKPIVIICEEQPFG